MFKTYMLVEPRAAALSLTIPVSQSAHGNFDSYCRMCDLMPPADRCSISHYFGLFHLLCLFFFFFLVVSATLADVMLRCFIATQPFLVIVNYFI